MRAPTPAPSFPSPLPPCPAIAPFFTSPPPPREPSGVSRSSFTLSLSRSLSLSLTPSLSLPLTPSLLLSLSLFSLTHFLSRPQTPPPPFPLPDPTPRRAAPRAHRQQLARPPHLPRRAAVVRAAAHLAGALSADAGVSAGGGAAHGRVGARGLAARRVLRRAHSGALAALAAFPATPNRPPPPRPCSEFGARPALWCRAVAPAAWRHAAPARAGTERVHGARACACALTTGGCGWFSQALTRYIYIRFDKRPRLLNKEASTPASARRTPSHARRTTARLCPEHCPGC